MVTINLLPAPVLMAEARRHRLLRWSVSGAVAAAILAVPLAYDWVQGAQAVELREENDKSQVQLTSIRTDLRSLTTRVGEMRLQLDRADALRSKRAWSAVLKLIGREMPSGCWLTSVATVPPKPSNSNGGLVSAPPNGAETEEAPAVVIEAPRQMKLSGFATDAAEPHAFVAQLKSLPMFKNVYLERSHREPALDGVYFRFELVCEW